VDLPPDPPDRTAPDPSLSSGTPGGSPRPRARHAPAAAGVRFRLHDGTLVNAHHGDLLGRLTSSPIHIDDPAVSEAHALVSLRAGGFRLLALRGRLAVDDAMVKDVLLVPGRAIRITQDIEIRVESVQLPEAVLAIEADGLPRQALPASCAIVTTPRLQVVPSYRADALAWIWSNGAEWNLRLANEPARPLRADEAFIVEGHTLTTSIMALDAAGGATTLGPSLDLEPLVIEARYDVVHIHRGTRTELTLVGKPARIVSELALLGGTADWELLAREVWPDEGERAALRRRFDVCMVRLRQKLRAARIRPDLVRPLGTGVVELVLHPSDRVVDAS
jgi:hypothetical protein